MIEELSRLLSSRTAGYAELETVEMGHSQWSKTYYFVRNLPQGFTGMLETGVPVFFQYLPMRIERSKSTGDLDYEMKVTLQDLNEIIAVEEERVPVDSDEEPYFKMRSYIYRRDRSISPLADGPFNLTIGNIDYTPEGASFIADAIPLNMSATGIIYAIDQIPMLKGFVV